MTDLSAPRSHYSGTIKKSLYSPLITIADNSGSNESAHIVKMVEEGEGSYGYNARTGEYEDLVESGVIDPTKVSRCALENAASTAAMLIMTDCTLSLELEEEPKKQ